MPDEKVPVGGALATCQQCKTKFEVKREVEPDLAFEYVIPPPAASTQINTKPCPFCGEEILSIDKKCKHCGSMLDEVKEALPAVSPALQQEGQAAKSQANKTEPPKTDARNVSQPVNQQKFDWATDLTQKDKIIMLVLAVLIILVLFTAAKSSSSASATGASTFVWILTSYFLIKKGMIKWKAIGCGFLIQAILSPVLLMYTVTNSTPASSTTTQKSESTGASITPPTKTDDIAKTTAAPVAADTSATTTPPSKISTDDTNNKFKKRFAQESLESLYTLNKKYIADLEKATDDFHAAEIDIIKLETEIEKAKVYLESAVNPTYVQSLEESINSYRKHILMQKELKKEYKDAIDLYTKILDTINNEIDQRKKNRILK